MLKKGKTYWDSDKKTKLFCVQVTECNAVVVPAEHRFRVDDNGEPIIPWHIADRISAGAELEETTAVEIMEETPVVEKPIKTKNLDPVTGKPRRPGRPRKDPNSPMVPKVYKNVDPVTGKPRRGRPRKT